MAASILRSLIATWLVRATRQKFVADPIVSTSFGTVKRRHLPPSLFLALGFGTHWVATSRAMFIVVLLVLIHEL